MVSIRKKVTVVDDGYLKEPVTPQDECSPSAYWNGVIQCKAKRPKN